MSTRWRSDLKSKRVFDALLEFGHAANAGTYIGMVESATKFMVAMRDWDAIRVAPTQDAAEENCQEIVGLYETVIACLVKQLGGEVRIDRADLEMPPELEKDDDPVTGEWIYRTV